MGYEPGSIKGKYQFGNFGTSLFDTWVKHWGDLYGQEQARQCIVPSAMVDPNGHLYALTFYCIRTGSYGIDFHLYKLSWDGTKVSSRYECVEPWRSWVEAQSGQLKTESTPYINTDEWGYDADYFKNCFPATLQPAICQDVAENSDLVVVNFLIPATRFCKATVYTEGLLCQVRKKSNFSVVGIHYYNTDDSQYSFHHVKPRRYNDSWAYGVEAGIFSGASYFPNHCDVSQGFWNLFFPALKTKRDFTTCGIYNLNKVCKDLYVNSSGVNVYPCYIKFGSSCYGLCCYEGNSKVLLFSFDPNNCYQPFQSIKDWGYAYQKVNHNLGDKTTSYHYDFCIVKAKDGTGIACVLGLRQCNASSFEYTPLSENFNERWNLTHINWGLSSDICLMLTSHKIDVAPSLSSSYEDPQNMIYTTRDQYSCPFSCGDGLYSIYGLYNNTHKCCVYEAASGVQYIIYCYCYPGKKKQLYLGYAMCWVDKNYKVQLGPKFEFRENANQWSNSFSNFTSCSRIISMDCKNGHLWITWMSADDKEYRYFHILAKDLVGE